MAAHQTTDIMRRMQIESDQSPALFYSFYTGPTYDTF